MRRLARVENASDAQKASLYAELYSQYKYCMQDAQSVSSVFHAAAQECGATVSQLGSLFCEEMSCAGYDPQRRQLAAPVKIKQTFGFGGVPLPGSREYVLHCVEDAAGVRQPVGTDSVHLSNALAGNTADVALRGDHEREQNLQTIQQMNNQTRRARSILSWLCLRRVATINRSGEMR